MFACATSSATTKVLIACYRLFTAEGREPTRTSARPMTSEAEVRHCTRCRSGRKVVACNSDGAFGKPRKQCRLSKGFGDFDNDALSRHLVVQTGDELLDLNGRVCRFRVGAVPDKLDVEGKRLDTLTR